MSDTKPLSPLAATHPHEVVVGRDLLVAIRAYVQAKRDKQDAMGLDHGATDLLLGRIDAAALSHTAAPSSTVSSSELADALEQRVIRDSYDRDERGILVRMSELPEICRALRSHTAAPEPEVGMTLEKYHYFLACEAECKLARPSARATNFVVAGFFKNTGTGWVEVSDRQAMEEDVQFLYMESATPDGTANDKAK